MTRGDVYKFGQSALRTAERELENAAEDFRRAKCKHLTRDIVVTLSMVRSVIETAENDVRDGTARSTWWNAEASE